MKLPEPTRPFKRIDRRETVLGIFAMTAYGMVQFVETGDLFTAIVQVLALLLIMAIAAVIFYYVPTGDIAATVLAIGALAALDLAAVYIVPAREKPLLTALYEPAGAIAVGVALAWEMHQKGMISWPGEDAHT